MWLLDKGIAVGTSPKRNCNFMQIDLSMSCGIFIYLEYLYSKPITQDHLLISMSMIIFSKEIKWIRKLNCLSKVKYGNRMSIDTNVESFKTIVWGFRIIKIYQRELFEKMKQQYTMYFNKKNYHKKRFFSPSHFYAWFR